MDSQHHKENREHQEHQDFSINDSGSWSLILKSWFSWFSWFSLVSLWFWLSIGPEILVFLIFLVFLVFLVFSMVLATHWYWNLGFLVFFGFLYGFGYPSGLHICIALVFSMVLQIAFAFKVVSSCIPYTFSFPSCLHTWMPLVFIGFTNGFCFHSGFQLRSCMPPMSSSMYRRAFLVNDILASTRACVSK